jgi:hypothetical protein
MKTINGKIYPFWGQFVDKSEEFTGGVLVGQDFACGFDVKYGGVTGGDPGWITFSGYGGHTWRIHQVKP